MFKSKTRPIIIPQSEHGKQAGLLASLWGNEQFDKPPVDFSSFVNGVVLHDWAYGLLDTLPIGESREVDWLEVTQQGVNHRFADPVTDIVAKLHLKRLLLSHDTPERNRLAQQVDKLVAGRLGDTPFSLEQFAWADWITRFCDMVSFDFCFEAVAENSMQVYANLNSRRETTITYHIGSGGQIGIDPWPFSVSSYSGIMIGYQQENYPDRLEPVVINFRVNSCG